jgi:TorA maturation chaperone TorD
MKKDRSTVKVKAWLDPDLRKKWEKLNKKHGYLFWVKSMLVSDEDEWHDLIRGREPNFSHVPQIPNSPEEYVKLLKKRREIYFQLFRSFTDPSLELVKDILSGTFSEKIRDACSIYNDSRVEEGLNLISKFVERFRGAKVKKLADDLSGEYLMVFYDGLMPWVCCYESIYLSEKQTMGDSTQEVKDLYRMASYNVALRFGNDPPDDIKIEIEFMFRLCDDELKAWKRGDKELALQYLKLQREHITKHMAQWVPYFCDDLVNEELKSKIADKYNFDEDIKREYREGIVAMDFYRGLGLITKTIIEHDYTQVEAMIKAAEQLDYSSISKLCMSVPEKNMLKENFHLVREEEMIKEDYPYLPSSPKTF